MSLKAIIASTIIAYASISAVAQQHTSPAGETTDSLSIATAVMWNDAFVEMYQNDPQKADSLFRGMNEAIKLFESASAYDRGLIEGVQLMLRRYEMMQNGIFINPAEIVATLSDLSQGKQVGMNRMSAEAYLKDYFNAAGNDTPDTVSVASQEAFLNEQLSREGVIKTASGLLFETIKEGNGASPHSGDKVKLLYTGRLSDGTVFDQTKEGAVEFSVDNLVPGFIEGLKLMKAGGRYRIYIPAQLGYGAHGASGVIPGNAVLDFTIELIEVIPATNK